MHCKFSNQMAGFVPYFVIMGLTGPTFICSSTITFKILNSGINLFDPLGGVALFGVTFTGGISVVTGPLFYWSTMKVIRMSAKK